MFYLFRSCYEPRIKCELHKLYTDIAESYHNDDHCYDQRTLWNLNSLVQTSCAGLPKRVRSYFDDLQDCMNHELR